VIPQAKAEPSTTPKKETPVMANKRQIRKKGASSEQNQWIQYAYERCGLDCVLTFEAESGWILLRESIKANRDGTRDFGVCQLNSRYHKKFINSQDFQNPYKQLDYCIGVWNDAIKRGRIKTTFYGYNVRHRAKHLFE
jgi:hypothetical protein